VYLVCVCVFAFDLCVVFIVFFVFFEFILVPRHKSRESVKIGPHPRGHPSSAFVPWTSISEVYAPGSPQILSWRGGLLSAVGRGRPWLASLRSLASVAPVGPLQP
jgi:hypothetical protein